MDWLMAAEPAASGGSNGYLNLALVLAAIGALGLFTRWRKSKLPPTPTLKELRQRDADAGVYRDAADKALVDLIETGREINAQVDTKIRLLNKLVKDAETQIRRLEEILAKANGKESLTSPQVPIPPLAATRGSTRVSRESTRKTAGEVALPRTELHERIATLRAEGKNHAEIARAANLSLVEVQLALSQIDASGAGDKVV